MQRCLLWRGRGKDARGKEVNTSTSGLRGGEQQAGNEPKERKAGEAVTAAMDCCPHPAAEKEAVTVLEICFQLMEQMEARIRELEGPQMLHWHCR